jgi:glycosyltransferase involved in cell wall biosynthesis
MDFTVIICTYNRSHNLPGCVEYLSRQQDVETFDWEVLVVDNNSSDDTRQVVEQLAKDSSIKLRYAFEPQQGLNYARNHGVTASDSRYFCFVDDDIKVRPDWLAALYQALESNDADTVGGRIHLDPDIQLPPWVTGEVRGFLGYQDYGEEPFWMDGRSQYPYGGNMSFNRRVVDKIGMFNPKVGRKGEGRKRGELFKGAETDYFHRLAATGDARFYYEPRAIVYHQVQPHQLERKYLLTIHYNAGFQKAYFDTTSYRRRVLGAPLFLFPQCGRAMLRYLGQLLTRGPNHAFRQLMTAGNFLGTMAGYRKAGREAARS